MQLVFDPFDDDDVERFSAVRKELIDDEMREWLVERDGDHEGEPAVWAHHFVGWKVDYGDGDLADVTVPEARDFLLAWCPSKVAAGSEEAPAMCRGLSRYVEFMASTGRLRGGAARAAELIVAIEDMVPEAMAAMDDPANFGMAKSLLSTPLTGADGLDLPNLAELLEQGDLDLEQLQGLLSERMDQFNALPFDERKAATDPMFAPPEVPRFDLDYVHVEPSADELAAAADTRLRAMVNGLYDWLGDSGKAITSTGNFRLADARELVDLLGTDDLTKREPWQSESFRSSSELPTLTFVADLAEWSGAVERLATKMKRRADWAELDAVEQAAELAGSLLEFGALADRPGSLHMQAVREMLDDGLAHLLIAVLPPDTERSIDEAIEFAWNVVSDGFEFPDESMWYDLLGDDVHELLDRCEMAGLVEIDDRMEVPRQWGGTRRQGGSFRGTALLRLVLPDYAEDAGYDFERIPDVAAADIATLLAACASGDLETDDVLAQWWTDRPASERAAAIAEVAGSTTAPLERVMALDLLHRVGEPDEVGPHVRQLLDSPASAHAAMYLLDHGLATLDEVGGFVSIGPLVDMLATFVDQPDLLVETFEYAQGDAESDLIDDMWRHDQPETASVLEALGRHLPDKAMAKAARKAVIRHRTWLANQR